MRVSWANQWRQRHAQGDVIIARYADDIVVGFEHETEARLADMRGRLAKFALMLHGEKTRLSALTACRRIGSLRDPIEFGRFAAKRRSARGEGKPGTFLGFTHICGRGRSGGFQLRRKTRRDRMRARLAAVREGCGDGCIRRSANRAAGCARWRADSSPITRCRPTRLLWGRSDLT